MVRPLEGHRIQCIDFPDIVVKSKKEEFNENAQFALLVGLTPESVKIKKFPVILLLKITTWGAGIGLFFLFLRRKRSRYVIEK